MNIIFAFDAYKKQLANTKEEFMKLWTDMQNLEDMRGTQFRSILTLRERYDLKVPFTEQQVTLEASVKARKERDVAKVEKQRQRAMETQVKFVVVQLDEVDNERNGESTIDDTLEVQMFKIGQRKDILDSDDGLSEPSQAQTREKGKSPTSLTQDK